MTPGEDVADGQRAEIRQSALVVLCVLGLLVAGFALPKATDEASGSDPGGSDGNPLERLFGPDGGMTNDSGDGGNGEDPPGDTIPLDPDELDPDLQEGCIVALDSEPTPGRMVTVLVLDDGEPVPDRRVWFNDDFVGRTDSAGRVSGRIPYEQELRVRVAIDANCRFVTPDGRFLNAADASANDIEAITGETGPGLAAGPLTASAGGVLAGGTGSGPVAQVANNSTGTYSVDGRIAIRTFGRAIPGETITVQAAIDGVPMAEARVIVDGRQVGTTDDDGRFDLQVPDDGRDAVSLRVSRGDFSGSTTLEVLLLEVAIAPDEAVPLPGGPTTVRATVGGDPVAGATVLVDGERRGVTDEDGELEVDLPAEPSSTVTVRTSNQATTVSLWVVYTRGAAVLALAAVLSIGTTVYATRRYGRRAGVVVGAGWLGLGALVAGWVLGGRTGLIGAAIVVGAGWFALAYRYRGEAIVDATERTGGLLAWLQGKLVAAGLLVADLLVALGDAILSAVGRVRAWARTLPSSVRGLLGALAIRLGRVPAAVRSGVGRIAAWLRGLRERYGLARLVATVVVAGATIAAGYYVGDIDGAVAVTLVLAIVAVLVAASRRERSWQRSEEAAQTAAAYPSEESEPVPTDPATLRAAWRIFARHVIPEGWESRTPGEVARRALEEGLPRQPVVDLTRVFREVEYGTAPLSEEQWTRAKSAFDELRATWDDEESGGAQGTAEPPRGDDA